MLQTHPLLQIPVHRPVSWTLEPLNIDTLYGAIHVGGDRLGQDHAEIPLHRQVDLLEKHHKSAEHFENHRICWKFEDMNGQTVQSPSGLRTTGTAVHKLSVCSG